jgi:NTE family protein
MRILPIPLLVLLLLSLLLNSACQMAQKASSANQNSNQNQAQLQNPSQQQSGTPATTSTGHETPLTRQIPTVTIVLGPGGAKAMAHAGVLKAFQENRIPIGQVIGIEWGALVGAAFAAHGQYHEVEWKLYKLEQIDMSGKGFLGLSSDHSVKILDTYFKDNFGALDSSSLKIPFACPSRSYWTGTLVWQRKGLVREEIRKCLPFSPLFQIQGSWLAASTHVREVVEQLKADGHKLVVLVDVLGSSIPFSKDNLLDDSSSMILWQDVQRSIAKAALVADEVIHISTKGVFVDHFDQRKELVQVGEQEGLRAAQRLSAKYGF